MTAKKLRLDLHGEKTAADDQIQSRGKSDQTLAVQMLEKKHEKRLRQEAVTREKRTLRNFQGTARPRMRDATAATPGRKRPGCMNSSSVHLQLQEEDVVVSDTLRLTLHDQARRAPLFLDTCREPVPPPPRPPPRPPLPQSQRMNETFFQHFEANRGVPEGL